MVSEKVKEILETKPYKVHTKEGKERALYHLGVLYMEIRADMEIKERKAIYGKILVIRGALREHAEEMQGKLKI